MKLRYGFNRSLRFRMFCTKPGLLIGLLFGPSNVSVRSHKYKNLDRGYCPHQTPLIIRESTSAGMPGTTSCTLPQAVKRRVIVTLNDAPHDEGSRVTSKDFLGALEVAAV